MTEAKDVLERYASHHISDLHVPSYLNMFLHAAFGIQEIVTSLPYLLIEVIIYL